jgi:three-Cys-motif partner protein
MAKRSAGKAHRFGGDWTETKLSVIGGYLRAYTKALQDQPSKQHPFRKAYIDAFAGTGYRDVRDEAGAAKKGLLFPDLADAESQGLLDGSARIAVKVEPRFDRYLFIERRAKRCADLEQLKTEFPDLAGSIDVRQRAWFDEFYKVVKTPTLFGEEETVKKEID